MNFNLPAELHQYCFSYLGISELLVCSEVSQEWNAMARDALFNGAADTCETPKILQKLKTKGKITAFFDRKDSDLNTLRRLFTASTKKAFDLSVSDLTILPTDFASWDNVIDLISDQTKKIDFGYYATINSSHFKKITKFSRLKALSLTACNLENKDIVYLSRLPLESLSLTWASKIDFKMFLFLPQSLTHLEITHTTIEDRAVKNLPRNIRHLSLGWVDGLTKDGLFRLAQNLESIKMNDCFKVTEQDFEDFAEKRPRVCVGHSDVEPY